MRLRIEYSIEAREDLREIRDYIARDNPAAARKVLTTIEAEIELLSSFPWNSRTTDEEGVLARILSRYPYIVFYKIERDRLMVLHVLHGARRHLGFREEAAVFASL